MDLDERIAWLLFLDWIDSKCYESRVVGCCDLHRFLTSPHLSPRPGVTTKNKEMKEVMEVESNTITRALRVHPVGCDALGERALASLTARALIERYWSGGEWVQGRVARLCFWLKLGA